MSEPVRLNDPVPASRSEEMFDALQHQRSQTIIKGVVEEFTGTVIFTDRMKAIVIDHTDSVPFMKKVQEYADEQIDKRLFKNIKVVIGVLIGWLASIAIAVMIAKIT